MRQWINSVKNLVNSKRKIWLFVVVKLFFSLAHLIACFLLMNNFDIPEKMLICYCKLLIQNYSKGKVDLWSFTSQALCILKNDTSNSDI